jgi:TatD DNase family protein
MFPDFDEDREEVIHRAKEAGLERIVNVGCGKDSSELSVKMAREDKNGFLYATVGLHPYDALDVTDELLAEWEKWIVADKNADVRKIVAIGETGLDYFKSKVDPEKQKFSFKKHLELAVKMGLPVIVHNRSADEDCLNLLKEFSRDGEEYRKLIKDCGCDENEIEPVKAVFHCYGSTLEFARRVWGAGFTTSFTGIITYPSAKELREVVREVPLDKFMVETDCPYLAPQAYRGKRNEPSYVVETAKMIAEVKGLSMGELEETVMKNTNSFFRF